MKIPDMENSDLRRRVGDCIYNFSTGKSVLRTSVHSEENVPRDLRGVNVLLSDHFYYFGANPKDIPEELHAIIKQGQGHKSSFNDPYKMDFVKWVTSFREIKNEVCSMPNGIEDLFSDIGVIGCIKRHCQEDDEDERIGISNC